MKRILLLFIQGALLFAEPSKEISTIKYAITLDCPQSVERDAVEASIPAPDYQSPNSEEWTATTVKELELLLELVKSGKYQDANVEFGTTNPRDKDLDALPCLYYELNFSCLDCEEIQRLSSITRNKNEPTYKKWAENTVVSLHDLLMILHKGNVYSVENQSFQPKQGASHTVSVELHMHSLDSALLQEAISAIQSSNQTFSNKQDWTLHNIDAIHKIESAIFEGMVQKSTFYVNVNELNAE